jgi:hypothetical protein
MHRSLLVLALALLLAACHKPEPPAAQPPPSIDYNLRAYLGIRTIDAKFTLPDSAQGYYPVTIFFADGKEVARKNGPVMLGALNNAQRPMSGDFQLLWQYDGDQFRRAAVVDGANTLDLSDAFPHWQQMQYAAWRSVPMQENVSYQGITILGIIAKSADPKQGPVLEPVAPSGLASIGQYVVAIGVCYGSDYDALKKQFISGK